MNTWVLSKHPKSLIAVKVTNAPASVSTNKCEGSYDWLESPSPKSQIYWTAPWLLFEKFMIWFTSVNDCGETVKAAIGSFWMQM